MTREFQATKVKKKSRIKKILKWSGIVFLLLLITLISLPFIFKDKLVEVFKTEMNNSVNAKVDFGDFIIRERQPTKIRIETPNTNVDGSMRLLSKIFGSIETNKKNLNIHEYSISQTSLEQIFNYFAAQQEEETGDATSGITIYKNGEEQLKQVQERSSSSVTEAASNSKDISAAGASITGEIEMRENP